MSAEEKRRMASGDRSRPVRRVVTLRGGDSNTPIDRKSPSRSAGGLFGGPPAPPPAEVVRRPKPELSPERKRWEELTEDLTSIHGRPYDPSRTYSEGDIVLHKQYGMGVVEDHNEEEGTISVLFREGLQDLAASGSDEG